MENEQVDNDESSGMIQVRQQQGKGRVLDCSEDEYEEIELEIEVTASESESEDVAKIDSVESSQHAQAEVSVASISVWNDSSCISQTDDETDDVDDDSHATARSAPIPISRKKRFVISFKHVRLVQLSFQI